MASISVTVTGASKVQQRLARAAASVNREQLVAMRSATAAVERHVKKVMLSGPPGSHPLFGRTGAPSPMLGSVSGHLSRSVTSTAFTARVGAESFVIGTVGTPVLYARTHEDGATIKGNPWLRIPTKFAKTPAGVDRLSGVSARTDPSLFVVQSRKGNLWLVRMKGAAKAVRERASARALAGERHPSAGARGVQHRRTRKFWPGLIPMYLLVKQVTIPARKPFRNAMEQTRTQVVFILRDVARRIASQVS